MKLNKPIFFSMQVGKSSVYTEFIKKTYLEGTVKGKDCIKKVIKYLGENESLIGLSIYGDDLNEYDLEEVLKKCRKLDIKVAVDISCNTSNLTFFWKYKEYIDVVRIVLYSLDQDRHNSKFENNDYKKVMEFISTIETEKIGKVIVVPILDENCIEIDKIADYATSKGFKINPLPIPCYSYDSGLVITKNNFNDFLKKLVSIRQMYKDELYLDLPISYEYFNKSSVCPALRLSFDVAWDGRVRPCKFTNIVLEDIENIGSMWTKYAELWNSGECGNCSGFNQCGGGCIGNKITFQQKDFYCSKNLERK